MPREHVKLVSAEGFEFLVDYDAACVSNTIKSMLSSQGTFTETEQREIRFPDIPANVLEKVCQYFYYKLRYQHAPPNQTVPEFEIPQHLVLKLLMAANYLDA